MPVSRVEYHVEPELSINEELKAYAMAVVTTLRDLVRLNPLQSEAIKMFLSRSTLDDPGARGDPGSTGKLGSLGTRGRLGSSAPNAQVNIGPPYWTLGDRG